MNIGTCVRRLHVPPGYTGRLLHCPDCGKGLCRLGEGHATIVQRCARCKDGSGDPKQFTIIQHSSVEMYVAAVKHESYALECV